MYLIITVISKFSTDLKDLFPRIFFLPLITGSWNTDIKQAHYHYTARKLRIDNVIYQCASQNYDYHHRMAYTST